MGRNKLFSLRLSDEVIQALADRFPGLSTVEAIRGCIEETLGLSRYPTHTTASNIDVVGTVNEILKDVYTRLDKLENAIAIQVEQEADVLPPEEEVETDSPDIGEKIRGILRSHPEAVSMAAKVAILKAHGIKIPGKGGKLVNVTGFNLEAYL